MEHKKTNLLQNIYTEHLKTIHGVSLTRREVDIIAFFISGRSTKKIASFFLISPKTVENHTHNIMLKFGCNSREGIIDFVEKSDKLSLLRKYYAALLAQAEFDKCLKLISALKGNTAPSCTVIYDQDTLNFPIAYLEADLKYVGINVVVKDREYAQRIQELRKENFVIYFSPLDSKDHSMEERKRKIRVFCYLPGTDDAVELLKEFEGYDLSNLNSQRNYYSFIFEILKTLFPKLKFEHIISNFEKEYQGIEGSIDLKQHQHSSEKKAFDKQQTNKVLNSLLIQRKWYVMSALFIFVVLGVGTYKFKGNEIVREAQDQSLGHSGNIHSKDQKLNSVRSDFDLPIESALLNRSELIAEIEKRFKGNGIQAVALVGIGGAGKTTLARHYAYSQESPVVWEINAETKETLNGSFEDLAQALAKTQDDEKVLRGILKIQIPTEREDKLIQFVKERLRASSNWFLIYDDVEKFTDIQKYFPKDPGNWGQGKIILTTQDSNIVNNKYVNNSIFIKELTPQEKLSLFIKIMSNGGTIPFTAEQNEEAKRFLVEIPPFPLDVSVAAYYLKATNVSYKDYLENMLKYNKDFSNVQEKILQETGDYPKTRYGIITFSLKHLIDSNDDFRDLLLFVSLLDSQNISRDLLIKFKSPSIVDDFIYHLKQYSFIQNETVGGYHLDPTFSIHRSTQAILLAYLTNTLKLVQNKNMTQPIAMVLEKYMTDAIDKEDFSKMKVLYRHAEQILSHESLLNDTAKASLSGELGCIFYYLWDYSKAKNLLEKSIAELRQQNENDYEKVARFLVYLGNVYRRLGDHEQAKKLFEQSLVIYKKSPETHVGLARASGCLGVVYENLGDFNRAKALLEESLRIHNKYPDNLIGRAWSLAHLGSVYKNLGDYEKARELFEQSLAIYKTVSENYVGAAWVCVDLGYVYMQLGDFKKAKDFLEQSLVIYNKHFLEDHVYVARALANLGIFYREQGDYEKAKELLTKSIMAFEKTNGKDHVDTGWFLENLGRVYILEGDFDKAQSTMMKALGIFEKNKCPDQYMVLEDLADLYQKKGMKPQAISYLSQALEVVEIYFPEDSPHMERIRNKLTDLKRASQ